MLPSNLRLSLSKHCLIVQEGRGPYQFICMRCAAHTLNLVAMADTVGALENITFGMPSRSR